MYLNSGRIDLNKGVDHQIPEQLTLLTLNRAHWEKKSRGLPKVDNSSSYNQNKND